MERQQVVVQGWHSCSLTIFKNVLLTDNNSKHIKEVYLSNKYSKKKFLQILQYLNYCYIPLIMLATMNIFLQPFVSFLGQVVTVHWASPPRQSSDINPLLSCHNLAEIALLEKQHHSSTGPSTNLEPLHP